jgi:hypothetical protein
MFLMPLASCLWTRGRDANQVSVLGQPTSQLYINPQMLPSTPSEQRHTCLRIKEHKERTAEGSQG